ncbi:DUF4302 domain-containing protein [Polaribacter sp. Q13]|uniref:DUF4302 domain-containing protein n=1 Tax=Polaribacter sp. Q13 TaxID=2806551 RepID=UPI00193B5654|nr:DUF4302 domain-containing protein [Polaribacter sp. Q13]QVY64784.1 DUF4302 domain-containing protein [Polaribacter sp. Q13]
MKQIINKISLIAVAFFILNACTTNNDPDEVFNEVPSVRLAKQKEDLKELLQSSEEGWKVTYFTDDSQLGGYTYLMDFTGDNTVEMDSDFGATKGTRTASEWDVTLGSTVKLTFTTRNKIHELSDSNNAPDANLTGQGYLGSFEFLYYGTDGDDIIFRANRGFNEVVFKKATSTDWSDLSKNDAIVGAITGQLAYEVDGDVSFFSFNNARRFMSNLDTQVNDTDFGIGYTPTGIIVSPAIKADNGNEYSNFTLNDAKNKFVSEDGEFSIEILVSPFNISDVWTINVTTADEVSDTFLNTFNQIYTANTNRHGETLVANRIFFGGTPFDPAGVLGASGIIFRSEHIPSGNAYWAQYNLSFAGVFGNPNQLNITKVEGAYNWRFYTQFQPLVDLIADNAPYQIEPTPTIDPTVVKLTSASNPDVWFLIRIF